MATNNILDLFSLLNLDMKEKKNVAILRQRRLICRYIERSVASGSVRPLIWALLFAMNSNQSHGGVIYDRHVSVIARSQRVAALQKMGEKTTRNLKRY